MLKLSIVIVALLGVSLAYKHHGYETSVRHVPHKSNEITGAIPEKQEQSEIAEAVQDEGQAMEQDAATITEGVQEENGTGVAMEDQGAVEGVQGDEGQSQAGIQEEDFEHKYYTYPKYKYEYGVRDFHTGDHKSQWEIRDGDFVKGEYTLVDADGSHRIVKYKADDKKGFRANVIHLGKSFAQQGALEESQDGQDDIGGGFGFSYTKLKRYY